MRFLMTFCIGVAATLGWQTYGDQAREIIAGSYPQLAWVSPRAAAAQTSIATTGAPARSAADTQFQELTLGLAAMRQRVDQLSFQQEQMTRDITAKVQAAERDILDRIAAAQPKQQEAAATVRKPAPPAAPQTQSSQLR